jgi:rRNA maturation endonuclease Nob1
MNCHACAAVIPDGGKFCPECGTSVARVKICKFCQANNPVEAAFCAECGAPFSSDMSLVGSPTVPDKAGVASPNFLYRLDESNYQAVSDSGIDVPYGAIAVTIIDGHVGEIKDQGTYEDGKPRSFMKFLKDVLDSTTAMLGKTQQKRETYILLNLKDLPVVSYTYRLAIPGVSDASLRFEFWIESDGRNSTDEQRRNLGLFFQRYVGGRKSLTITEFRNIAVGLIPDFVEMIPVGELKTNAGQARVSALILRATGIASKATYLKGRKIDQRLIDISQSQNPTTCSRCATVYSSKIRFCEICGHEFSPSDWVSNARSLQVESGEEITIRFRLVTAMDEGGNTKTDNEIAHTVIEYLGPVVERLGVGDLKDPDILKGIDKVLQPLTTKEFDGYINEITAIDIRTVKDDWVFKTEALVSHELRKLEANKAFLRVDEAETDLMAAAFSIAMRRLRQANSEQVIQRKAILETKTELSGIELQEHKLDVAATREREILDTAAERERMLRERGLDRERATGDREDEVLNTEHQHELDIKVAKHNINLADLTGDAQSRAARRGVADTSFEREEAIRLGSLEKAQLGHIDEDLQDRQNQRQLTKLEKMAELEANMARQDHEFELSKMAGMKGMSASEMLALQASELVRVGGSGSAAEIVKAMAESHAASSGAQIKEGLYERMLEVQKEAGEKVNEAHKLAAESALRSSENMAKVAGAAAANSNEGYKEAARIAQTTNEKSMENMAKVATATAARKADGPAKMGGSVECRNPDCNQRIAVTADGTPKKFCPKCGFNQLGV